MCDTVPAAPAPTPAPVPASDAQPPPPAATKSESPKPPADAAKAPEAKVAAAATAEAAPGAAVNGPSTPPASAKAGDAQQAATPEPKTAASTPDSSSASSKAASTPSKAGATPKTPPADGAAGVENGPGTAPGTPTANFRAQFRAFSRFGDPKSDGRHLTLSQSDKWLKQARVVDGKKVTTTDTGIYFKKLKQQKLGMEDYKKFLEDLAKNKKLDVEEVKAKMSSCGAPGLSSSTGAAKAAATVERLTDPTRYTGAHKQRFDETGRGKGIAGRKDIPDASGYVQGYQNKNTYDKTH